MADPPHRPSNRMPIVVIAIMLAAAPVVMLGPLPCSSHAPPFSRVVLSALLLRFLCVSVLPSPLPTSHSPPRTRLRDAQSFSAAPGPPVTTEQKPHHSTKMTIVNRRHSAMRNKIRHSGYNIKNINNTRIHVYSPLTEHDRVAAAYEAKQQKTGRRIPGCDHHHHYQAVP